MALLLYWLYWFSILSLRFKRFLFLHELTLSVLPSFPSVNSLSSCLRLRTDSLINSCLVILQSFTERWETLPNNYKRLTNDWQTRHKGCRITQNGGGWRSVTSLKMRWKSDLSYEHHSPAGRHKGEVGCSVGGKIAWAVQWAAPCKQQTENLAMSTLVQAKDSASIKQHGVTST